MSVESGAADAGFATTICQRRAAPPTLCRWTDDFQARIGSNFDAMKIEVNSKDADYQSFQREIEEAFGP